MTESADSTTPDSPIVARAGTYYRNARYIMVAAVLAFAAYFGYDGWVGYPKQNARIDTVEKELIPAKQAERLKIENSTDEADRKKASEIIGELGALQKELAYRHSDNDILLQKLLALTLPIVALGYATFFIRRSRGEVRFENGTLHAPGHPPVALSAVKSIDNGLWKKKGIAYVEYEAAPLAGTIKLDDFIYQQKPIDQIQEIISKHLGVYEPPEKPAQEPTPEAS